MTPAGAGVLAAAPAAVPGVSGARMEVRVLVALPGILTARLVLGRRGLL